MRRAKEFLSEIKEKKEFPSAKTEERTEFPCKIEGSIIKEKEYITSLNDEVSNLNVKEKECFMSLNDEISNLKWNEVDASFDPHKLY